MSRLDAAIVTGAFRVLAMFPGLGLSALITASPPMLEHKKRGLDEGATTLMLGCLREHDFVLCFAADVAGLAFLSRSLMLHHDVGLLACAIS